MVQERLAVVETATFGRKANADTEGLSTLDSVNGGLITAFSDVRHHDVPTGGRTVCFTHQVTQSIGMDIDAVAEKLAGDTPIEGDSEAL